MNTKEFKVPIPKGMEIDKENSTFECIKFKPIKLKRWRDDEKAKVSGYIINLYSNICSALTLSNSSDNYNVFATKKQAKSARAMAYISQIIANDERFGGVVTDKEWCNDAFKYVIGRIDNNTIYSERRVSVYHFLAFHTEAQRDLFLKENEDLVKDYLMIDQYGKENRIT